MTLLSTNRKQVGGHSRQTLAPPFTQALICAKEDPLNPDDTRLKIYRDMVAACIGIDSANIHALPSVLQVQRLLLKGPYESGRGEGLIVLVEPTTTVRAITWRRVISLIESQPFPRVLKIVAVDTQRSHSRTIINNDGPTYAPNPNGPQQVIAEAKALGHDVLEFTQATAPQDIQRYFADLAQRTGVLQNSTSQ